MATAKATAQATAKAKAKAQTAIASFQPTSIMYTCQKLWSCICSGKLLTASFKARLDKVRIGQDRLGQVGLGSITLKIC